jgi:hypothetical protein
MQQAHRQSVARTSNEPSNYVMTLYKWKKAGRLQGEVVQASEKEPEGWKATREGDPSVPINCNASLAARLGAKPACATPEALLQQVGDNCGFEC